MKKVLAVICFLLLSALNVTFIFAEEKFSWDFSDCEIKDVLYAISLDTGRSIIPDDTVKGKTDFSFTGTDFEKAFDSFLKTSRLYVSKDEEIWTVSRVQVLAAQDSVRVDSFDVRPELILEKISEKLSVNISYEQIVSREVSVHLENSDTGKLLESFAKFLPGFILEKNENGFHFAKEISKKEKESFSDFSVFISENGKIKIDIKSGIFSKVCELLFQKCKKSFCFIGNADIKACRTSFESESFESSLQLLCKQNNFCFENKNDIIYVFPNEEKKNSYVYGKRNWVYFPLRFSTPDKILSSFSVRFRNVETVHTSGADGFWANVTESETKEILSFIQKSDIQKKTFLVQLKNIKAEDFLKKLPPSIDRNSISEADGNSCLYFSGTSEAYKKILEELELCDRPQKRLKYDLLIIQYDETEDNQWASGLKVKSLQKGERSGFSGQLGSVLSLNLNVLSALGLDFAVQLQNSLSNNKSRVFADTTLHGIAGKEINFSNTNTYRYRDNNLDPETGKPVYTGVTREIVSGLKLDIKPWVGEDGLITTHVKASVTRRGTDTSSITGNPPPTSEKIVTTEVSGKSGEPVILSGLVQNSESNEIIRTPVLSKIPVIGKMFKSEKRNSEKSQMVIYLVPFLENIQERRNEEQFSKEWLEKRKEGLCRILSSN